VPVCECLKRGCKHAYNPWLALKMFGNNFRGICELLSIYMKIALSSMRFSVCLTLGVFTIV
jgi:hypothetical protein